MSKDHRVPKVSRVSKGYRDLKGPKAHRVGKEPKEPRVPKDWKGHKGLKVPRASRDLKVSRDGKAPKVFKGFKGPSPSSHRCSLSRESGTLTPTHQP